MSQLLIVYKASGRVFYQYNAKTSPFNDFIYQVVNETAQELPLGVVTASAQNKRFYGLKRDAIYVALYFDSVTTVDADKIKTTLLGVAKTYAKYEGGEIDRQKLSELVNLQFTQLMSMRYQATAPEPVVETPSRVPSGVSTPTKESAKKSSKKMRKWVDGEMVEVDEAAKSNLDFSTGGTADDATVSGGHGRVDNTNFTKQKELVLVNELQLILAEKDEEKTSDAQPRGFFLKMSSYFGGQVNLEEVLKKFYDQLVLRNVSPPMAKQITEKLHTQLTGKKVTLAGYKQALVDELTKILTPNVSTDLLYEVKNNVGKARPYVISVVGVNGVGKLTNLAKLAYWFLQNNLNVLICACDTFRSGAVEQLKVHVNHLARLNELTLLDAKIDLFEKGYGSGDHVVATAKAAIEFGGTNGFDVILIDTAGRTHSNSRLMAPLKKFGDAANPDKIIMVGEALVGTDSVEQAVNFNNAFGNRRGLDFFIISKVDTVGELVGTMINMVMATNVPILFVGTGQTYTDIKRLSTKTVVDMLMS